MEKMLTPEIVRYLTTIHEYKGEQRLIAEHHADVLESLVEVAKIQSTESSNKCEGLVRMFLRFRFCGIVCCVLYRFPFPQSDL